MKNNMLLALVCGWGILAGVGFAAPSKGLSWDARLAEAELISEPKFSTPVEGRLVQQVALRIDEGALTWACHDLGPTYFIEFWFRPLAWSAIGREIVELCSLTVGTQTYVLSKVADKSNLSFNVGDEIAAVYPTYAWDDAEWAQNMSRKGILHRNVGWHHLRISVAEQRLHLNIDGFPAREIKPIEVRGALNRLVLSGNPGTAFTLPLLERGGTVDPIALRQRYLALFLNAAQIRPNLVLATRLKTPPQVDGRFAADEWNDATQITGWVSPASGRLLPQEITGYIGYDDERLYLAVLAPSANSVEDTHTSENAIGLDIFLGPPFVSGENPRRLLQFTGTLTGEKSQRQMLPVRNDQWRGKWNWATAAVDGQRFSEFSARFEDIDLPAPAAGETWSINLVDRQANAVWVPPVGEEITVAAMAELQFDPNAPVIRNTTWAFKNDRALVSVKINGLQKQHHLTVGLQLYGGNDFLPTITDEKQVAWENKSEVVVDLGVAIKTHLHGRVAVYVKDGKKYVYYHSARFPVAKGGAE